MCGEKYIPAHRHIQHPSVESRGNACLGRRAALLCLRIRKAWWTPEANLTWEMQNLQHPQVLVSILLELSNCYGYQGSRNKCFLKTFKSQGLISLVIWETQIKTIIRYHFTHTRMAVIRKSDKFWQRCGEMKNLIHYWWEYKMVQSLWKTSLAVPQTDSHRVTI